MNIEEIKKEVREKSYHTSTDYCEKIDLKDLFEILDKYKDQDKYKNAWEELKEFNINDDWYINETQIETIKELIEELEQKHNLGGE